MSGISVVGRDTYGVFPLRGKVLNVREATPKQILENKEFSDLKKIIGLQQNMKYKESNMEELRYQRIMIATDQDEDGIHIKGLLFNLFQYFWPSLLKVDGFLTF